MAAPPTKKKTPIQAPATAIAMAAPAKLAPQPRNAEVHTETDHMSDIPEIADGSDTDLVAPNNDDTDSDIEQVLEESAEAKLSA